MEDTDIEIYPENLKGENRLEDKGTDGRLILK
jgi:hypothetical protein